MAEHKVNFRLPSHVWESLGSNTVVSVLGGRSAFLRKITLAATQNSSFYNTYRLNEPKPERGVTPENVIVRWCLLAILLRMLDPDDPHDKSLNTVISVLMKRVLAGRPC